MSEELLPCPLCKSADLNDKGFGVECRECGLWLGDGSASSKRGGYRVSWNTRPDSKRPDLTNYPNLASVLQGCVSGTFGEWPGVRAELSQLLESFGVPDSNTYKYAEHSDWWAVFGKIFDFDKEEEESSRALFRTARERQDDSMGSGCNTFCKLFAEAHMRDVESALADLLDHYTGMINSGDCGNWDPEEEAVVIKARKALADIPPPQEK